MAWDVIRCVQLFRAAEFTFNSIFFVEFLIKLIALGGFNGKSGYFNDPWNRYVYVCMCLFLGFVVVEMTSQPLF